MSKELMPHGHKEKKHDPLGFIPSGIRNMVIKMLCRELKKNNVTDMLLKFDESKDGQEAFSADFNVQQKIIDMDFENKQLKFKIERLHEKINSMYENVNQKQAEIALLRNFKKN